MDGLKAGNVCDGRDATSRGNIFSKEKKANEKLKRKMGLI